MAEKKQDENFGGANVAEIGPPKTVDGLPLFINISLSFEEALKLHLSLGQAVAALNRYNRSTADGRKKAVLIKLKTKDKRLFVTEGEIKSISRKAERRS
jgi:hypothetical protein